MALVQTETFQENQQPKYRLKRFNETNSPSTDWSASRKTTDLVQTETFQGN